MGDSELAEALRDAWTGERPHVERVVLAAAIITTALERAGMRATLVGGAAIEFYAPDAYATADLDFVVEGRSRDAMDAAFNGLGMQVHGRHWTLGDLFVEVPGNHLAEQADEFVIGPHLLRVIQKEYVLADRIIGYRWWKHAAYGLQAIDMLASLRGEINEIVLRAHPRKEGAEDTYDLLLREVATGATLDEQRLRTLLRENYG